MKWMVILPEPLPVSLSLIFYCWSRLVIHGSSHPDSVLCTKCSQPFCIALQSCSTMQNPLGENMKHVAKEWKKTCMSLKEQKEPLEANAVKCFRKVFRTVVLQVSYFRNETSEILEMECFFYLHWLQKKKWGIKLNQEPQQDLPSFWASLVGPIGAERATALMDPLVTSLLDTFLWISG